MHILFRLFLTACILSPASFYAQDSLSFGGIYDLPGAEVRADYEPVSPLAKRFTIEEVYRLPSTFYDPARLVALLPGVSQSNDQANHLSVRGNSPNKNLWRLNGLAIVNPNHTANAGTFNDFPSLSGGGVNAISAQILDNSGFYSGGLPIEYGNATGGTFDLQLRPGNKSTHTQQVQAGFIGFDLAAEGPLDQAGQLSYLVNARYSFTGLLGDAGVDFGGEEIRFADVNAHLHYANDRSDLSVFAIYGLSTNDFGADPELEPEDLEEQKELFDISFEDELLIVGSAYTYDLAAGELKAGVGYSSNEPTRIQTLAASDAASFDSAGSSLDNSILNGYLKYQAIVGRDNTLSVGVEQQVQWSSTVFLAQELRPSASLQLTNNNNIRVSNTSPYISYRMVRSAFTLDVGVRQNFYTSDDLIGRSLFSPRLSLSVPRGKGEFVLAAGRTSQVPTASFLGSFVRNRQDFQIANPTDNVDISYGHQFGGVYAKATAFAQRTVGEPVVNDRGFLYSANNLLAVNPFLFFTETTDTRRYGVEVEAAGGRKDKGWYYRGSLTLLSAETQQRDGSWATDRYAVDFIAKATVGREWPGTDKQKRSRTFGLNAALIARGGERFGEIEENPLASLEILNYFQQPNHRAGFENQLGTYFRPDLRLYKTKVRAKTTTTLALDIQNIAGVQNVGNVYYDFALGQAIERLQLGLIPVLSYRIVFR